VLTVAVVAYPGVVPFDLATPCEVFGRAVLADGRAAYRVRVCAAEPEVDAGWFVLRAPYGLDELDGADLIVVPGTSDPALGVPPALLQALRAAAARGVRIASICSGAFVLAAAGILDGRTATTHWLAASDLARSYPSVRVDPDVLYVESDGVYTSAGAAAGLDLCLHLVRVDHGAAVAADAARRSVMPLERAGGQAQFIVRPPLPSDGAALDAVLAWAEAHVDRPITLADLGQRAGMSPRTLHRRFREQTGLSPLQWILRARLHRAQQLLETTGLGVDVVADRSGFGSPTALREQFRRVLSTSPAAYRRAFRGRTPTATHG